MGICAVYAPELESVMERFPGVKRLHNLWIRSPGYVDFESHKTQFYVSTNDEDNKRAFFLGYLKK